MRRAGGEFFLLPLKAVAASTALVAAALLAAPADAAPGGYTAAQAAQGASMFGASCASCHAQNLTGGAGPALVGAPFHASINANYKTAAQLYGFISKQMPLNAPGSLSKANYLAITAF